MTIAYRSSSGRVCVTLHVDEQIWTLGWQEVASYVLVYPRIVSTDLNRLICKTPLIVKALGVAAHRITSVAWKKRAGGIVRRVEK
jgi:hypothetical protein